MTYTHTYAELDVSADTYDEIAEALRKVDYDHAFMDNGTIDMHGIGLTKKQEATLAAIEPASSYVSSSERKCLCPYPPTVNQNCWCHERMGNDFWFLPADTCLYEKPNRWRNLWAEIKRCWNDESSGGRRAAMLGCICPQRPKSPHHPCFHSCANLGGTRDKT